MENEPSEITSLLLSLHAQMQVLKEAVMQLIEQQVKPVPGASVHFERAMRARLDTLLRDRSEDPHAQTESEMTLLLAALLSAAGRPPKT